MKVYLKRIFILFLLNSTVNADNGLDKLYTFIGVQTAYTQYDNIDAPTIGFKYGKQTNLWRTAIMYNYGVNSNDIFHSFIIQVDRGVLMDVFGSIPFKPYIGFSLGTMKHKNNSDNDQGYLFGGNFGFNYILNNEMDIDLGYRYMTTSKFTNLDDRGDLLLSLHYYFD
ncbi:MAG: outer membrane beta-barrel protein [Sulfurovaceae bacterium]|nr:outer membrane beta-barrel protein [Sulfurovaceae bacterium]